MKVNIEYGVCSYTQCVVMSTQCALCSHKKGPCAFVGSDKITSEDYIDFCTTEYPKKLAVYKEIIWRMENGSITNK